MPPTGLAAGSSHRQHGPTQLSLYHQGGGMHVLLPVHCEALQAVPHSRQLTPW